MKFDQYRRSAMLLLGVFAALLSGCTTYVTTQVTAFSDWGNGSDATRTYAFARSPSQENSLEQTTYENIVANELAMYGFKQASATQARYWVGLTYAIKSDMATVSQPVYYAPPPIWGPYWRPVDPWGPWGPWGPYPSGYVTQSFPVYTHVLGIRITERATGKEVYNVTARNANDDPSLVSSMPYLVRSALADFPAGNGAVRTVKIAVDKNGGASNEVALPSPASASAAASGAAPSAAPKPAQ
ncbi:DUF4136 domain-containing protein [Trinickia terrae]|uniref:DUF4136 domain-containing protein n=1 Tax=Trinickia terrae TaxID=2571161 RepID=A0A4U1IDD8_9BURK|nr:DUF4136 domain-containing protein [Trinickia terrae]TKC91577.1 DUF4136 domain-containing protein [Trinickia terrae]